MNDTGVHTVQRTVQSRMGMLSMYVIVTVTGFPRRYSEQYTQSVVDESPKKELIEEGKVNETLFSTTNGIVSRKCTRNNRFTFLVLFSTSAHYFYPRMRIRIFVRIGCTIILRR